LFSQISYLGKISQHEDGTYGLTGAMSLCFSMDKKNIYVSGQYSLAVFNYNENTGSTDFIEAYRNEDDGNNGLNSPACVKVSHDDKFVYVSSDQDNSISLYKRDVNNGKLDLIKIFYDTDEGMDGLRGAHEIGLSKDGKYIYVAAWNDAKISVFKRDTTTGYISHLQSIGRYDEGGLTWPLALKISRDGRFVYVASHMAEELSVFEINPETGELIYVEKVYGISGQYSYSSIEISYDNKFLYLSGLWSLGIYKRDFQTGKLVLQQLFTRDDPGISGIEFIYSITVSPDDKNIYAISAADTSFVTFSRNLSNDEFQFVESKPFMNFYLSNYGYSNTGMICDEKYVFGASYWESGVHMTKRNQTDGSLIYEKFIHEGDDAVIDGLYNPRSCSADEQNKMVYVSTAGNGISILQRNDTTGKLIYKNVVNNTNQHSGMLTYINKTLVSKDGNYLYALCQSNESPGVAIFEVDHSSDDLILIDSIMADNSGSNGIDTPTDFAFSPNGEHLYTISSFYFKGITQFSYNPQNGSLEMDNHYEFDNIGNHFDNICIGNNGKYVFIWNTNYNYISMLGRNKSSGELTYLSTISLNSVGEVYLYGLNYIAVSKDNKNLYASYEDSDVLVNYSIDTINNKLEVLQVFDYVTTEIEGLQRIQKIGVRNDGTFVYTSSYNNNSLGLFYRDQSDGKLTFLKDYTEFENDFDGLDRINGMSIPNDDRNLYLISSIEEAVASYSIDVYLGPDKAICRGDSVLLDAGKGYSTYLWSTNETTQRIYAKEEGYYYVKTTDEFGFNDYDTMLLKIYQKPELDLGPDIAACYGTPVVLNTGFNGETIWNTGATSESIAVNNSGTYSVVVSDIHYCKNRDSVNVIFHSLPEVNIGGDTTIGENQILIISVDSIPDYQYLWYNGTSGSSIKINSDSISNNSLEVWLEVTSNYGCKNSDIMIVTLDTTHVYFEPAEIKVGPIPTDDLVNIKSNYIISNIDCFDLNGKFLFSKEPNSKTSNISAVEISRGIYYLRITLNNGFTKTFKIIRL